MKYLLRDLCFIFIVFLLGACASKVPERNISPSALTESPQKIVRIDISNLPATYTGIIPCAECGSMRCHLNLMPDGSCMLKRTCASSEPGRADRVVVDSGTWHLEDNGRTLVLSVQGVRLYSFAVRMDGCIKLSDTTSKNLPDSENIMCRRPDFEPVVATGVMRGLYSYMAGVGLFKDCSSGMRYRVAMDGDNAALEHAYTSAEHGVAEPLVVKFEGFITSRPAMEHGRMDQVVVVQHFLAITPARSCRATPAHTGHIENIRWQLVEISGEKVVAYQGMPLPGFRLNPKGNSLRGFGGCNRMMGTYRLNGSELRFDSIATTRKFCENSQGLEDRFLQALEQVRQYKVKDNMLELYGEYGLLARLESAAEGS